MIWDIHFGDGTTIRAKHEKFHCACIIAQAQRIQYGETHEQQLAVLRGTLVQKPESGIGVDLGPGRDVSAVIVRIPDESTMYTFDKSEKKALCEVLNDALKSAGPVKILITKGDEL